MIDSNNNMSRILLGMVLESNAHYFVWLYDLLLDVTGS